APKTRNVDQLMIAFASMACNGLILAVGESTLFFCSSILRGMDAMTRLVVNLPEDSPKSDAENELVMDLRVAVHRQTPVDFLKDISQHSLNLVILCNEEISPMLVDQLSKMLSAGGCVLVPKTENIKTEEQQVEFSDFHQVDVGDCLLFVNKPFQQENVRRGGRRARLAEV
ncbi:hypothetical protein J4G02_23110, partial [Candidatus Poribacteria bacterium]|nr:hypothetical protein [Candidatus Poribacteria bacterium]